MNKTTTANQSAQVSADDRRRPERQLSREAYALLAQANLLRMRGEWAESTEKCMAALRLSPDNPSAQSLLGDIYENQGRLDDAIQWYRMALDVQPDSPADQIKLARLLDLKVRDLTPQPLGLTQTAEPSPPQLSSLPLRWRSDPERLLRRFAFVAGALAVLVVCVALVLVHRSGTVGLAGSPRQVAAPPVVVPSLASAPPPGASATPTPLAADPSETALLTALQASPLLKDRGISVASVAIDPRTERLTVTLTCQSPTGLPPSHDHILWDATSLLQAAAQQADAASVTQFTIRCLLASAGGGSTPLVFTADATRPAIVSLNPDLSLTTASQIAGTYTNLWWSPSLGQ